MKKRLFAMVLVILLLCNISAPAYAAEATGCEHTYEVTGFTLAEHTQTCTKCSDTKTNVHEWVLGTYDTSNHTLKYSTCTQQNIQAHTWGPGVLGFLTCTFNCFAAPDAIGVYDGTVKENDCTHDWSIKEYTETSHTLICRHCNTEKTENHTWGDQTIITEASLEASGTAQYICTGGCIKNEFIPKQAGGCPHEWTVSNKDETHHTLTCSKCSQSKNVEHTWGDLISEDDGHHYVCTECQREKIDAHTWTVTNYTAESHDLACSVCFRPVSGSHTWNEGIVVNPPTYEVDGMQILTCDKGTCTSMLPIPKLEGEDPNKVIYPIEAKYTATGPHAVKDMTFPHSQEGATYSEYRIWYPADMETSSEQYPVIIVTNGTGSGYADGMTDPEAYRQVFTHMASWGFIAVGNNDGNSGTGQSTSESLDLLLKLNKDSTSPFFGKVDTDAIGVFGHSQGGAGAINAATNWENSTMFKSVLSASATQPVLALLLQYPYDASKISVPCFLTAATGYMETEMVAPLESVMGNYNAMTTPAVMARRNGIDHGHTLYMGNGYTIAWFRYTLLDDPEAACVFLGQNPELLQNKYWQDTSMKNLSGFPVHDHEYINGTCRLCGASEPSKPTPPSTPQDPAPVTPPSVPVIPSAPANNSTAGSSTAGITVPVSGSETTVQVSANVSGSTATVSKIDTTQINQVIGEGASAGTIKIDFTGLNETIDTVSLPTGTVDEIASVSQSSSNQTNGLTIKLSDSEIVFDGEALAAITAQAGKQITLSVTPADTASLNSRQQGVVGDAPVFNLSIQSDSKTISDFGSGYATVTIPYTLRHGQKPEGVIVYYLDGIGNVHPCETVYNVRMETVTFTTTHFSLYFLGYDAASVWTNPFSDIEESTWYFDAVRFVQENKLMEGTSTGTFDPEGNLSRAQLAQILYNKESRPDAAGDNGFADVSSSAWYAPAITWAATQKIIGGYGNGQFGPNDHVTREQMVVMLWRYAGSPLAANKQLNFMDADKASDYAVDALCWAVENRIINGTGNGVLDPQGLSTRAQAAQILQNFISG